MRGRRRVWSGNAPTAGSMLRKTGRVALGTGRWLSTPIRGVLTDVRDSIRTERKLRAVPIGQSRRNMARVWMYATFGMAVLIVLAFFNNRTYFAAAVIAALLLGLMYVSWMLYRGVVSLLIVLVLWAAGGPLAAFLTAEIKSPDELDTHLSTTMPLFWATGAAMWLAAVLLRARRPWLMLLTTWALAIFAIFVVTSFARDLAFYVTWAVLAVYILWRGGWLLSAYDRVTGRAKLGADYEQATEGQYALYRDLAKLGQNFERFVQVAVASPSPDQKLDSTKDDNLQSAGDDSKTELSSKNSKESKNSKDKGKNKEERTSKTEKSVTTKTEIIELEAAQTKTAVKELHQLDALIVGATGLFYLAVLEGANDVTVSAGRPRRVLVEGKPADDQLHTIAMASQTLAQATDLEVTTLVMVHEGELPNRGLLATQVRVKGAVVEMTLLEPELLARRIKFGPIVYTVGQTRRILHRLRSTLLSSEVKVPKKPLNKENAEKSSDRAS